MNRVLPAAGPELNTHQEIPGIALLHPEPEEGDLVLGGEFEADPAAHHRVVTCLGYEAMAGRIAGDGLPARGNEGVGCSAHLDQDRNTILN